MLHGIDLGSQQFMHCDMGLGVFVADCGPNKLMIHQGANDGFRAIYIYCFAGPDFGKGITVLSNGELDAILLNSYIVQQFLTHAKLDGVNTHLFDNSFNPGGLKDEEIVNVGYKNLIFKAFSATLPEEILDRGELSELLSHSKLLNAQISYVSNQKFARAENLISVYAPKFNPKLFGAQGKIMDSWETARHNKKGFELLELSLATAANLRYCFISTQYHLGNHVNAIRLEAFNETEQTWQEILPRTALEGHSELWLDLELDKKLFFSKLRVFTYPDGGLTRLALFDDCLAEEFTRKFKVLNQAQCEVCSDAISQTIKPLSVDYLPSEDAIEKNWQRIKLDDFFDNASAALGGRVISATNQHYAPAKQVISPFRAIHMFDGLESARSRDDDHFEELVIQLAKPAKLESIELELTYFVNNAPDEIQIEGFTIDQRWCELAARQSIKAFAGNTVVFKINSIEKILRLKFVLFPDGGINRIRAYSIKKSDMP
jgi:allantoicase